MASLIRSVILSSCLLAICSCFTNGVNPARPFWNESLREKSDKMISDFRASIQGVTFSGVFTNNTVLQRGPLLAALYGMADKANTGVTLSITGMDSNGSPVNKQLKSNTDMNGDWKILMDSAMSAGGNYTFNIKCAACSNSMIDDTLYNVTFGDVYYCSGQSNMELAMKFTFSKNKTYQGIRNGQYSNLRYFTMWEIDTSVETFVVPHKYGSVENMWNMPNNNTLDPFSAPCWYFGQSLHDIYNVKTVPIGLIDVAIGGTMIEQWIKNQTAQLYCKDSLCPDPKCGGLYNGMVSTFVNMTIKSYLWWQGENNMHEIPGSWKNNTGYGCMQPFMLNQWRDIWSVVPQTTMPDTPFGLVTLAAGTDEGASQEMGAFRWAQMANYDYLPNQELKNVFVALAHDMGEPWGQGCPNQNPPVCMQHGQPYSFADTPQFMGPIHPRVKLPIGQRLAYAGYSMLYGYGSDGASDTVLSGALISGCTMDWENKNIVVSFNETFLYGKKIMVTPWSAWYNKSLTVNNWSAMKVLVNKGKQWQYVDGIKVGNNDNQVIVDISSFVTANNTISGLRYAWDTFPCCGDLNKNENPCPPDQCPIRSAMPNMENVTMPAVPFWAQIINDTCFCFDPQTC